MSALCLYDQGAAQRIEPEHRIGAGLQRDRGDGRFGDQIPIHRISEGFIHPHSVRVHRQSLGVPSSGDTVKP